MTWCIVTKVEEEEKEDVRESDLLEDARAYEDGMGEMLLLLCLRLGSRQRGEVYPDGEYEDDAEDVEEAEEGE